MTYIRRLRGLAALVLSLASLPALACGCAMPVDLSRFEEIARAFEGADEVYSAAVEEVRSFDEPKAMLRTDLQQAQLRVLQVWKGSYRPGQRLAVFTRNHPLLLNCSMEPAAGDALMIYGQGSGSEAGISTCSRSGPLSRAFPDLPVLLQLAKRSPGEPLFQRDNRLAGRPDWLPELLAQIYANESFARDSARQ